MERIPSEKTDARVPWLVLPQKFFEVGEHGEPPQYKKDALALIPSMWDKKSPREREDLLGVKFSHPVKDFYKKSWHEIVDFWGEEAAFQSFLYALYGDDKDPLYSHEERYL